MIDEEYSGMGAERLSDQDKVFLLRLAREALQHGVMGEPLRQLDLKTIPEELKQLGATFVTLTRNGELRGCIGTLEATRPLVEDVRVHAVAAALEDYRFPPLPVDELPKIRIEISRLTNPKKILFNNPEELLSQIRPGIDGVVIQTGVRRATFLPQVWDKVPDVEIFLGMLCRKMGSGPKCWRDKNIDISTYQVEKFGE